jgi:TP901 family phage tail tape measure protein
MDKYTIGTLVVRITADSADYVKNMSDILGQTRQFHQGMLGIVTASTAAIAAAYTGMAAYSTKAYADFEHAMIRSLSIMEKEDLKFRSQLETTARRTAIEIGQSVEKSAEAYYYLAASGLNAATSQKALPIVSKFAAAANVDLARATDLVVDSMNNSGLVSKDTSKNIANMTRLTDVLTEAANRSNASQEQLAMALRTKSGAAFRLMNRDVEEAVAILMVYHDQGLKSEVAGEALYQVVRDVQDAIRDHAEAWKSLDVSVYEKATGKIRPMVDILQDLEGLIHGLPDSQRKAAFAMLGFQDRSFAATQALLGFTGKIRDNQKAMYAAKGTLDSVSQVQLSSFNSQATIMLRRVQDVALSIGKELLPVLQSFNTSLIESYNEQNGFNDIVQRVAKTFRDILVTAIGLAIDTYNILKYSLRELAAHWGTLQDVGVTAMKQLEIAGITSSGAIGKAFKEMFQNINWGMNQIGSFLGKFASETDVIYDMQQAKRNAGSKLAAQLNYRPMDKGNSEKYYMDDQTRPGPQHREQRKHLLSIMDLSGSRMTQFSKQEGGAIPDAYKEAMARTKVLGFTPEAQTQIKAYLDAEIQAVQRARLLMGKIDKIYTQETINNLDARDEAVKAFERSANEGSNNVKERIRLMDEEINRQKGLANLERAKGWIQTNVINKFKEHAKAVKDMSSEEFRANKVAAEFFKTLDAQSKTDANFWLIERVALQAKIRYPWEGPTLDLLSNYDQMLKKNVITLDEYQRGVAALGIRDEIVDPLELALRKVREFDRMMSTKINGKGIISPEEYARKSREVLAGSSPFIAQKYGNLRTGTSGVDDALQGAQELRDMQTKYDEQKTVMEAAYNARIEAAGNQADEIVRIEAEKNARLKEMEDNFNAQRANNIANQRSLFLTSTSELFGSLSDIGKTFSGEQNALYKSMFAVSKAFAIADAMVKIQQGVANAAILPWPENFAAMASVAAATSSIVSNINAVKMTSFEGGGFTGRGDRIGGIDGRGGKMAIVHPNETITDHTKKQNGSGVTVQILNYGSEKVRQVPSDDPKKLKFIIGEVDKHLANSIDSRKGPVSNAMERRYGLEARPK